MEAKVLSEAKVYVALMPSTTTVHCPAHGSDLSDYSDKE